MLRLSTLTLFLALFISACDNSPVMATEQEMEDGMKKCPALSIILSVERITTMTKERLAQTLIDCENSKSPFLR